MTGIRTLIDQRRASLASPDSRAIFKNIYKHAFAITRQPGQKGIALDTAVECWRSLLSAPSIAWSSSNAPWLDWWIDFLQTRWKTTNDKDISRSVNKDMWDQTLAFALQTLDDPTLSWWNEDSAWPSVLDEFAGHIKEDKLAGTDIGGNAMDTL